MFVFVNILFLLSICLLYIVFLFKVNKNLFGIAIIASLVTTFIKSFPYSLADMFYGSALTLSVQYVLPSSVFEELARALIGAYLFKAIIEKHDISRKELLSFACSVAVIYTSMEKFDTLMFFAFTKPTIFHFDIQLFLLSLGMFLGFITQVIPPIFKGTHK